MEPTIELRVAELLASRLCHDLISPVGAVNSGIELMTEFGDGLDSESMQLVASSAKLASEKLQFFRIAYGNAGSGANVALGDGLRLIEPVCANQRTAVVIEDRTAGAMPGPGVVKLLLNITLVAVECLPRGGELAVVIGPDMAVRVSASGEGARIEDNMRAALDGSIAGADLDPRTAHGYFTHMAGKRLGVAFTVETGPGSVAFAARLPVAD